LPSIDHAVHDHAASDQVSAMRIALDRSAVRATIGQWVVHDLRGPVHGMALIGDMLAQGDGPIEPSIRQILRDSARRVRELLDILAQLFEPAGSHDAQPVALSLVLDMIVTIHRSHRGRTRLEVDRSTIAQLPAVRGATDDFVHILISLVLNALQAQRDQASGVIRLGGRLTADGGSVELTIEDDGPGLPAVVQRAFTDPSGDAAPWPGLGLSVARALARQWGGSLVAAAAPDSGGARFVLTLPVWPGRAAVVG
jgi:signal transduction histidine kinase